MGLLPAQRLLLRFVSENSLKLNITFLHRKLTQRVSDQKRNADNEQTHHQRVVLHSLSPCRMAGKRLRSELLGSFVGLGLY